MTKDRLGFSYVYESRLVPLLNAESDYILFLFVHNQMKICRFVLFS